MTFEGSKYLFQKVLRLFSLFNRMSDETYVLIQQFWTLPVKYYSDSVDFQTLQILT